MSYIKQEMRSLSESEGHFRMMANMIPDIVWTAKPNGERDFYNIKFTEYTGITQEEASGEGWKQMIHPDDINKSVSEWENSVRTGQIYENEYRFKRVDGTYRWFLIRAVPWKDENGSIIKWFGTTTDIHDEMMANLQLKQLTQELTNTNQELSSVNDILNQFVYIAAHDLKAPMNNIKMLFELLKKELSQSKKEELVSLIEISVSRLDRTVNGLMELIKSGSTGATAHSLQFENVLQIALSDLGSIYPGIAEYIKSDFTNCPTINYIQPFLISIFKNLLSNAYKYRSNERKLAIHIRTDRSNGWIKLIVRDNGKGFNMNMGNDIFAPFKRLTNEGEGTGIGLYVVKNIVEKNGGKVETYGEEENGATFFIFLCEYNTVITE